MNEQVFSKQCNKYSRIIWHNLAYYLRQCSCDTSLYPNISVVTDGISFQVTPDMYILGAGYAVRCYLAIDNSSSFPFAIFGDAFLQHNTVIFNKDKNQIGFIENFRKLAPYVQSWLNWAIFSMSCVLVLALLLVACGNQIKSQTGGLREPLPLNV